MCAGGRRGGFCLCIVVAGLLGVLFLPGHVVLLRTLPMAPTCLSLPAQYVPVSPAGLSYVLLLFPRRKCGGDEVGERVVVYGVVMS